MSKRTEHNPMSDLTPEEALELHFAVEPTPEFLATLEQKLLAEQAAREKGTVAAPSFPFWQRFTTLFRTRSAAFTLVLLLIVLIPLLLVGPDNVWAGLQAWLGYVPGVGFVDLEDNRVLKAPVTETREGITIFIESVVAEAEETIVVVQSEGLPPEEQFGPDGADRKSPLPRLRLPDGTMLTPKAWTLRVGEAALIFPPLPPTVNDVHLYMARLPLVPHGFAPEGWVVPLALEPVTADVFKKIVAEMDPLLPAGYAPPDANESHHGVTVDVLGVAHTEEETALHLKVEWEDERLGLTFPEMVELVDQQGNAYTRRRGDEQDPASRISSTVFAPPPRDPNSQSQEVLLSLAPVLPSAEHLTLTVEELQFLAESDASFAVDLGDDPQIGDRWSLDVELNIAGVPVYITRAKLVSDEKYSSLGPNSAEGQTVLLLHWVAIARDGRDLTWVNLGGEATFQKGFVGGGGGSNWTALRWDDKDTLPAGQLEIEVMAAGVAVRGPWRLTWPIADVGDDT